MKIMICAGEVSGDVHGSYLVKELKKLAPSALFFGVGSERLAAAGVDIRFDLTQKGTIGLLEALPNLFSLYATFQKIKKMALAEKPDLVVLIDSQGINFPLAKFCQKIGLKTVYYIAPQEWLWGTPKKLRLVAGTVGLIIAIFAKEFAAYKQAGANVVYSGHPLLDIVKPAMTAADFRRNIFGSLPKTASVISLCPGSRLHEIKTLFPVLLRASTLIKRELPDAKFVVPVASRQLEALVAAHLTGADIPIVVGRTYDALAASDLALCASGTINFEASLLGTPNIMVYKLSRLTYLIGKYILQIDRKLKYFSMPNILLDKKIIPELIMSEANPSKLAAEASSLMKDTARQNAMKHAFVGLRQGLGTPGVIQRAAEAILSFVSK
jgi:lipid-A-disaccharide synthase